MSRQPKNFEYLSCKLDREISEKFTDFCEEAASNKQLQLRLLQKSCLMIRTAALLLNLNMEHQMLKQ